MAAVLPHLYLVRPLDELRARFPQAWFAETHVWQLPSAGDHDFEGQQRLAEAEVKLGALATIYENAHDTFEPAREHARAFIELAPLTVATFDRFFAIERAGLLHLHDVHRLPRDAIRAVLPSAASDVALPTRGDSWSCASIGSGAFTGTTFTKPSSSRRFAWSFRSWSIDSLPRSKAAPVMSSGTRATPRPRDAITAVLREAGVELAAGRTGLFVYVSDVRGPSGSGAGSTALIEADVAIRPLIHNRSRRGVQGSFSAGLESDGTGWRVVRASLYLRERHELV